MHERDQRRREGADLGVGTASCNEPNRNGERAEEHGRDEGEENGGHASTLLGRGT